MSEVRAICIEVEVFRRDSYTVEVYPLFSAVPLILPLNLPLNLDRIPVVRYSEGILASYGKGYPLFSVVSFLILLLRIRVTP